MSLSTKHLKIDSKSKTLSPGNTSAKIYDVTLKPGYNQGSYYLVLNLEGAPISSDFEGFFIDPKDESKGRHEGQVGRVRFSQYAYETKTLPSGAKVDRDQNILKAIMTLAKALNVLDRINEIEADTIEQYVEMAKPILCNDTYLHYCIAGKEYTNKEGYTAYDLFLPKLSGKKYAFSAEEKSVLTFDESTHILAEKKKTAETMDQPFEPKSEFDF